MFHSPVVVKPQGSASSLRCHVVMKPYLLLFLLCWERVIVYATLDQPLSERMNTKTHRDADEFLSSVLNQSRTANA